MIAVQLVESKITARLPETGRSARARADWASWRGNEPICRLKRSLDDGTLVGHPFDSFFQHAYSQVWDQSGAVAIINGCN